MIYILDACSVIAFFNREEGQEKIWDILQEAENKRSTVYINIVNLMEVHYGFYRDFGKETALKILNQIYDLPITIIDTINKQVFDETSRLKSTYKISLADAIGLATAITLNGVFVTADGELAELEKLEHAPVFWFRLPKK
ncbi:hypothetical protein FACS1894190_12610 [Spirochaetia bacterium]|nr:hypothetical protein FACS1894190_12610 [Spirochaetia bacterium]